MMRFGVFLISDGVIEIIQSFNGDGRSSPLDFMKLPQRKPTPPFEIISSKWFLLIRPDDKT